MARRLFHLITLIILLFGLAGVTGAVQAQSGSGAIYVLTADGPVAPAMLLYLERSLALAADRQAGLVVVQLNTPGGSIDSMTRMIEAIRASTVPVIVYVTPRGAMAASAGTLITLAGHLSAMAPETTIGAASPVGGGGEDIGITEELKVKEVLRATVRGLTQNRPLEAQRAAEDAIERARALTVDEAKRIGLIDIKAATLNDLFNQLEGRTVIINDQPVALRTAGAAIVETGPTFIEQALALFTNPNLVFMFISLGTLAILAEISSPGGWVAGTVGVVLWLLGFFGLGILPVNWFGLLFLVLSFILFILDLKAPTHGALTIAGAISFIAGALVLFNSVRVPGIPTISVPLVVGTGLAIAALFFAAVTLALRAQSIPVMTGQTPLIGQSGVVKTDLMPQGEVQVAGETWTARPMNAGESIPAGTRIEVVEVDGLKLKVRRK